MKKKKILEKMYKHQKVLADLVRRRNALGREAQKAKEDYEYLANSAKYNEVFTPWGREAYKNDKRWNQERVLTVLRHLKRDWKMKESAYNALKDLPYQDPQDVYRHNFSNENK